MTSWEEIVGEKLLYLRQIICAKSYYILEWTEWYFFFVQFAIFFLVKLDAAYL